MSLKLSGLDQVVILIYLAFVFLVALYSQKKLNLNLRSFFLADGKMPGWLAGVSIVATTFAADTPLAVTGLIANKGISGNWMWLAWMGAHALVFLYFSRCWNRSGVITDAELLSLRYSGTAAEWLRSLRAFLSGVVLNSIVLAWVIKAMAKIVQPFIEFGEFSTLPLLNQFNPEQLTIAALLLVTALYSSMGGLRAVIITDLFQFILALLGSVVLAYLALDSVGGTGQLLEKLSLQYGANHDFISIYPHPHRGWWASLEVGAGFFAIYLLVQSFSNMNSDGGGYIMQRLNSTPNEREAGVAALIFLLFHYVLRIWPWFLVGLVALVAFPNGNESLLYPEWGSLVSKDREMAYPVLMGMLLPAGFLGLVFTSLLAAFMSTVDTHINWGASYVANDGLMRFCPGASPRLQIWVSRLSLFGFCGLAYLISQKFQSIEEAWRWVSFIGAALGIPTLLRWFYWRINAWSEILSALAGLLGALLLNYFTAWPFEVKLTLVAFISLGMTAVGAILGTPTSREALESFQERVNPKGFWPGKSVGDGFRALGFMALPWLFVLAALNLLLFSGRNLFLFQDFVWGLSQLILAAVLLRWAWAWKRFDPQNDRL